jgi:signal transduction histidine kinase
VSFALAPVATPQRARALTVVVGAAAVAAAAVGLVALAHGAARQQTTALTAVTLVAALSFVGSGLVAWRRRPGVWTGPLMIAAGFCLFAGSLAEFDSAVPFTIGLVVAPLPAAVLAQLVLSFPEGRLHSTAERVVVAGAYFVTLPLQIVMLMFMGFENVTGCPCPSNLLFVRDDMALHGAIMSTQRALGLALTIAAGVIVVRRWQRASRPLRRALAPILLTGSLTLALLAGTLLAAQLSRPGWAAVSSAERVAFALVPLAYLVGLFRARLGRVAVSDLVVELAQTSAPGRLRDSLARALRDPSLELAYWVPDSGVYVGIDGRRVEPTAGDGRTVTVLERRGQPIAALVHDSALAEDPALLDAVSSAAGLALENERLLAELRAQLEQLRESRARIMEAGDTERRRLERNLHDGAQQRLVSLALALGLAESKVEQDPATATQLLREAREELTLALSELRELARGIHPAVLTERGLSYALTALAERAPVEVTVDVELDRRPPPAIEAAAYYVVAEALANVAKYAHATTAAVSVDVDNERLRVEVVDDGVGGADPLAGSGLQGLDDRVQAFGGSLRLISPAGQGTRIVAELPVRP